MHCCLWTSGHSLSLIACGPRVGMQASVPRPGRYDQKYPVTRLLHVVLGAIVGRSQGMNHTTRRAEEGELAAHWLQRTISSVCTVSVLLTILRNPPMALPDDASGSPTVLFTGSPGAS